MREWERATWATGQTEAEVIRRVGQQLARLAIDLTRSGDLILILAGKGHNGDDARAARELLHDRKVELIDLLEPDTDLRKVENALQKKPALVIDGIFGVGLNRPLAGPWQKIIATINAAKLPVLAVDLPSGLNADTGEPFGAVIEAAVTLTVGAPKTGLLAPQAWPFVGRLEVADDVGLIPCPFHSDLNWTLPGDFQNFPPARPVAAHKGDFGHVSIIAGSLGYHGAAVLAARAAQRAQPGRITLFTEDKVYGGVAAQLQSVMVNVWKPTLKLPDSASAILIGPGLAEPGTDVKFSEATQQLWRDADLPLVVDASALAWLPPGAFKNNAIRVVTPHPGEAARLLKISAQTLQANRVKSLRDISRRLGNCWVVLKGHQTLIGRSRGEIFVNPSGNPHLAQGGSGDVLAGFLTGLLAQPEISADAGKTIRYAVWQHGAAADALQAQSANWTIEELAGKIGGVRR
jgi:ADP-dependent NAD(P)H-hydrate dehydratase / NAD(P)H-hydrate epimerase